MGSNVDLLWIFLYIYLNARMDEFQHFDCASFTFDFILKIINTTTENNVMFLYKAISIVSTAFCLMEMEILFDSAIVSFWKS